ncbi:hypothetical protein ABZ621_13500 [Streptomyces sp. NPDC007863]|uniref:hypothetical protein n=1 Tax=Streptomyces sp. NPDC007863 TaxID=3154894 RepID=UPI0033F25107
MTLLALLLVTLLAGLGLAGYGFGRLGATGVRRADRETRLRCGAALSAAAAAALYAWGLLGVGLAVLTTDDSGTGAFPSRPCRVAGDPGAAADVAGHRVSYLPPRYLCVRRDGSEYAADTGGRSAGPAALALLAIAGVSAGLALAEPRHNARGRTVKPM